MCIALSKALRTDSCILSEIVGCGKIVSKISSSVASNFIASANEFIISVTSVPIKCAPRISPVFHKNTQVSEVRNEKKIILKSVNLSNGQESFSEFDNLLVAVGVEANTSKLGLDFTSVKLNNHNIITHEYGKTDDDKILAIGDVAGGPWLAHKASHEGIICVEYIAGLRRNHKRIVQSQVPSCVYSHPQVASIGLTEKAAKEKTPNIRIGKFPLSANGKALSLSEHDGFVKTIFDGNTGEILGAHLIGTEVTEIINSFALAMKLEATEEDILETIFPHPTISESIHESVLNAFDKAIHI